MANARLREQTDWPRVTSALSPLISTCGNWEIHPEVYHEKFGGKLQLTGQNGEGDGADKWMSYSLYDNGTGKTYRGIKGITQARAKVTEIIATRLRGRG